MSTSKAILDILINKPELELKDERNGNYRLNSPFRPGSNSHGFTLIINDDEHGAYIDHVSGEQGSLYDLAKKLGIEITNNNNKTIINTRNYAGLDEYAKAHGTTVDIFKAAGWKETKCFGRPALIYPTKTGTRYHFLDNQKPKNRPTRKGYKRCWYGLDKAIKLGQKINHPLIICNGETSTISAQYHQLPAFSITGGETGKIPNKLLQKLQKKYTGKIIIALDCDKKGRDSAIKLTEQLILAGYNTRAVNLNLGNSGEDLADFCKLYTTQAAKQITQLKPLIEIKNIDTKIKNNGIKSSDYLNALIAMNYTFKLNELDNTIEVNENPITDITSAEIRTKMRDIGYNKNMGAIEDAYTTFAANNSYHPIKQYLESLPYDNSEYIKNFTAHFTDTEDIFKLWFKKWIVGSIAKIYENAQNPMLILDGEQGTGKSYLAAWLCPLQDYFLESPIQPDNNDHKILLMTTWLWEVSELGATTRRTDREALKGFISLKKVTARKPYGRRPITKPAMASFIGTVNNEAGFLNDPTGSRRFLSCTLTKIDWNYTKIHINNLWAEAYHLYKTSYEWKLTSKEKELQTKINNEYEIDNPLITEILHHYDITNNPNDCISSREILITLGIDHRHRGNSMKLAQAMKKLKISKGKIGNRKTRISAYIGLKKIF